MKITFTLQGHLDIRNEIKIADASERLDEISAFIVTIGNIIVINITKSHLKINQLKNLKFKV